MTTKITLTFTQCKQIIANGFDLHDFVERVNDQPDFMQYEGMGIGSISELQSIIQGGCASNAHPSVYYHGANKCMSEHGDSVLECIEEQLGDLPTQSYGTGWSQLASNYLSMAIELWCAQFADILDSVDWD